MEVVRQHPRVKQLFAELCQVFLVVIHSMEEHRLVQQLSGGGLEFQQGALHGTIDLVGMIAVHDHDDSQSCPGQHFQQLPVDALGDHDWKAAVQAKRVDVLHLFHGAHQLHDRIVGQRQRVAP